MPFRLAACAGLSFVMFGGCATGDTIPVRHADGGGGGADASGSRTDSGPRVDSGPRDAAAGDDRAPDPCAMVRCVPPEVCTAGRCSPPDADGDDDGYAASEDCDDTNPTVHPDAVETCDGRDDDCNGPVDDIPQTRSCTMSGACGGTMQCRGTDAVCATREPVTETCNGMDDDCNGSIDDVSGTCMVGVGACLRMGTNTCPMGCSATAGTPGAEACPDNGVDDDCNGRVDDVPGGCCECTGSATRDMGGCGNCGTMRQTCDGCHWGATACTGEGTCSPGAEMVGDCADGGAPNCGRHVCGMDCRWSGCQLYSGNNCWHCDGRNWRCCAASSWQYCLPSCVWSTACESCSGCCPHMACSP